MLPGIVGGDMPSITPYPDYLFDRETQHLMVWPHQDDEVMYAGLISRLGPLVDFVWVTNGDGLAPEAGADPAEYASMRLKETDAVLETLGRPLDRRTNLAYSEITIYDRFADLTRAPERRDEVMAFFGEIADAVYREVARVRPQVVWVPAFQNGHPEHDLVHIVTALALRRLRSEGQEIALYQVPEYEYLIFIPHRFHPRYKGIIHALQLTPEEAELKHRCLECYPSQMGLFRYFERIITGIGHSARLVGRGFTIEDFMALEQFGPVDRDMDYTRSTHAFEWANYINEKHDGVKIRFDRHIAEIAKALTQRL